MSGYDIVDYNHAVHFQQAVDAYADSFSHRRGWNAEMRTDKGEPNQFANDGVKFYEDLKGQGINVVRKVLLAGAGNSVKEGTLLGFGFALVDEAASIPNRVVEMKKEVLKAKIDDRSYTLNTEDEERIRNNVIPFPFSRFPKLRTAYLGELAIVPKYAGIEKTVTLWSGMMRALINIGAKQMVDFTRDGTNIDKRLDHWTAKVSGCRKTFSLDLKPVEEAGDVKVQNDINNNLKINFHHTILGSNPVLSIGINSPHLYNSLNKRKKRK